jgi:hypothetical protein
MATLGVLESSVASPKKFRLTAEQIQSIAPGHGSCIASDHITVGGEPVGFMYREAPSDGIDSGWRFFSGLETEEYTDNPDNFAVYDVNTIANYDRDIVALLDAEIGSSWARGEAGAFENAGAVPGGDDA